MQTGQDPEIHTKIISFSHLNPNTTHPMEYIFHFGVTNTKIQTHTQKIQNVKCNLHIFFIKKYLLV